MEPNTKVKFLNKQLHETDSAFYPEVGTIGVLVEDDVGDMCCLVEWPKGSVEDNPNGGSMWYCGIEDIEEVKEDV